MKKLILVLGFLAAPAFGSVLDVVDGGTGASTASGARTSLGAAASGVNTDITKLNGVAAVRGTALTGTVSVTAGTAVVTGTGTAFNTELAVGSSVLIGAEVHKVKIQTSNTSITLDANHAAGASGATARVDNGTTLQALDPDGNLLLKISGGNTAGGLGYNTAIGGFIASAPHFVAQSPDTYRTPMTGTTSCDTSGVCTGTGTHYVTEAFDGDAIDDPQNPSLGEFLFINHITDNTHMTLLYPPLGVCDPPQSGSCDGNGFSGLPMTKELKGQQAYTAQISTPAFTDAFNNFPSANYWSMDNIGRHTFFQNTGAGPTVHIISGSNGGLTPLISPSLWVEGNIQLGPTGVAFQNMGACTIASSTLSTTATNETCTGVPASASVAVNCAGAAAFSLSTGGSVYCRATGTANQIACNTILANTQAMAFNCMWVQP